MRSLPLYDAGNPAHLSIEDHDAVARDPGCTRCPLHVGSKRVCLEPVGEPGGLLVVADGVSRDCAAVGEPMQNKAAIGIRKFIEAVCTEVGIPVAFTTAVSCEGKATATTLARCAGHLRADIERFQPSRIFAMGSVAAAALVGRPVRATQVRRGYAMTSDGTPIFYMIPPRLAASNRHIRSMFARDVEWALTADVRPPPWGGQAHVVTSPEDARAAVDAMAGAPWVYFDCEWAGGQWDPDYYEMLSVALARPDSDDAFVWSLREVAPDERDAVMAPLLEVLADGGVGKIAHSGTGDLQAITCAFGVRVANYCGDSFFWRQQQESDVLARLELQQELVGMGGGKHPMDALLARATATTNAERHQPRDQMGLFPRDPAVEAAADNPGLPDKSFSFAVAYEMDRDLFLQYNALDAVSGARLAAVLEKWVRNTDYAAHFWDNLLGPMIPAFARMEEWGMLVDLDAFDEAHAFFEGRQTEIETQLAALGLHAPSSPQQVGKFLFDKLGLEDRDAPSTNAKVLKRLEGKHHAVKLILDHREATTALTRYCNGLPGWARNKTHRVHTSFKPMGTRTGRASSSDPNLLNLPSRSPVVKKAIKRCFVAPPGYQMVVLDYSQAELRVAAMMSGDEKMIQVFQEGRDIHWETARTIAPMVWGIGPDEITPELHRIPTKCVDASTLVWTATGPRAIGSIADTSTGDTVPVREIVADGQGRDVPSHALCNNGERRTVHVVTRRGIVTCTPNHKFLTTDGWVEAQYLEPRQQLIEPIVPEIGDAPYPSVSVRVHRSVPATNLQTTAALARLAGLYHGDGSKHGTTACQIHHGDVAKSDPLGVPYASWQNELVRSVEAGGFVATRHAKMIAFGHVVVHRFLEQIGVKCGDPRVPDWVLRGGRDAVNHYLGGVFDTDGCVDRQGRLTVTTKYAEYGGQICALLLALRLDATVEPTWNKTYRRWYYRIAVPTGRASAMKPYMRHAGKVARLRESRVNKKQPNCVFEVIDGPTVPVMDLAVATEEHAYLTNSSVTHNTFVFSLVYGKTDNTLARELKLPLRTIKKMRAAVLGEYVKLGKWLESQIAYTEKYGVSWAEWDGKRAVCRQMYQIASPLDGVQSNMRNAAMNTPVQGSAALFTFASIPPIIQWIDEARVPARITNTVYDSIVAEVRDDWVERFVAKCHSIMTSHPSGGVPMKVDATVGPTWADQEPWEKWLAAYGSARDSGVNPQ